ncbi:MAG: peroxidase family protein, partial [Candidatus Thorarchaeota archaeon]
RANENVALTAMHTVFVREHNRLCDEAVLLDANMVGQDEVIFQYARRMVSGMMQQITYNEFLPALLGGFSEYTGYDRTANPNIDTEFSTAGYRLGHTMLSENIQIGTNAANTISLVTAFFNPAYIQTNGINNLLIGSSLKKMQEIDNIIVEAVRSFLFGAPTAGNLLDLAAINMQRGRDHGLPGYNAVRNAYGLPSVTSFAALNMPAAVIARLTPIYDSPDDIDPWIGVISENHMAGKAVGELANAILVDQFTRLRNGDRYWFENDNSLTAMDVATIQTTTLAGILTRNTNYTFNSDVFHI